MQVPPVRRGYLEGRLRLRSRHNWLPPGRPSFAMFGSLSFLYDLGGTNSYDDRELPGFVQTFASLWLTRDRPCPSIPGPYRDCCRGTTCRPEASSWAKETAHQTVPYRVLIRACYLRSSIPSLTAPRMRISKHALHMTSTTVWDDWRLNPGIMCTCSATENPIWLRQAGHSRIFLLICEATLRYPRSLSNPVAGSKSICPDVRLSFASSVFDTAPPSFPTITPLRKQSDDTFNAGNSFAQCLQPAVDGEQNRNQCTKHDAQQRRSDGQDRNKLAARD